MDIISAAAVGAVSEPSPAPRAPPALPHVSVPAPKPEQVNEAVAAIQANVASKATNLRFSVDNGSGRTIVTVVDTDTKEVIRQIPTEEVMEISRALDRMQGMLLNSKA